MLQETDQKKGHLESSLGATDLAIALHYVFNTPTDILIWDVGHQAYSHKIITDRASVFRTNRLKNGISGFPKRGESPFDPFSTGHSSTSISALMGFAISAPKGRKHIAVIGDGALTGGMAFEALNHIGQTREDVLVVLNDNEKSIDDNVGGLATGQKYSSFFTSLGWAYYGPSESEDLTQLIADLKNVKDQKGPRVLHVKSKKESLHTPSPSKGISLQYQDVFAETLSEIMDNNPLVFGITPAMLSGSSLDTLINKFPERIIDTGITEQHALTLSAGLAADGKKPFVHIYSTFLQRAVDQLIHDIAMQNLPVTLVVDRAGVVGEDGATHQGAFDLALCKTIPNLDIIAPRNSHELRQALLWSQENKGPTVIRFPRGSCDGAENSLETAFLERGKASLLQQGVKLAVLGVGPVIERASQALRGLPVRVVDLRFASPMDEFILEDTFSCCSQILTLEEGSLSGGLGESIKAFAIKKKYTGSIESRGLPHQFIDHATPKEIWDDCGLSRSQVLSWVKDHIQNLPG